MQVYWSMGSKATVQKPFSRNKTYWDFLTNALTIVHSSLNKGCESRKHCCINTVNICPKCKTNSSISLISPLYRKCRGRHCTGCDRCRHHKPEVAGLCFPRCTIQNEDVTVWSFRFYLLKPQENVKRGGSLYLFDQNYCGSYRFGNSYSFPGEAPYQLNV